VLKISKTQVIECPSCNCIFLLRHLETFLLYPLSDEDNNRLRAIEEECKRMGIEVQYSI
jgi:hypothetical protein